MAEFKLQHTLRRHEDAIHTLAISLKSRTLLSAGQEGLILAWNLQSGEIEQEIDCCFHGPVACVIWLYQSDTEPRAFAAGFADGTVHVYERTSTSSAFQFSNMVRAHDGPVENMCWDPTRSRLATVGAGSVQIWSWTNRAFTALIEDPPRKPYIARTVHFLDKGASVLVSYLESHELHCYGIEPWSLKWARPLPTRIGDSCLPDVGSFLFVSNLKNGVDKYAIPTLERIESFPHPILRNAIVQLAFAPVADLLIAGGDDGFVRVFDHRTGKFMQRVSHTRSGSEVRTITCAEDETSCVLVSAASARKHACDIKVWSLERNTADPSATKSHASNTQSTGFRSRNCATALLLGVVVVICSALITMLMLYWVFLSSEDLKPLVMALLEALLLRLKHLTQDASTISEWPTE
ncbi:WD40 repeat-like protein [Coniophora puteana RWD-64-598 SS2]|uniref:WD40 repeat-like protein n=1 Tax=Coniophora puteana (strain RWD-64-598) TaxID=741705 RepID=A0A5M3MTH4_CONPW|nr:WD40 repeat-like protein [Coniophora puteana RWD-64-598 SS2]EIW81965.1 WD40 repeat-like protein [Coniophora puteana RWD-64-598 SS2]